MKSIMLALGVALAGLTSCTTTSTTSTTETSPASIENHSVKQTLTITITPIDESSDQFESCKITVVLSKQSLDPEQEPVILGALGVTTMTGEWTIIGMTEKEDEKYASTIKLRVGDGYGEFVAEEYGSRLIILATPEGDNFRAEGALFFRTKDHEQLIPISGLFPNGEPTIAYERTEHFGANAEAELSRPSFERRHFGINAEEEPGKPLPGRPFEDNATLLEQL
jgi:hypothetical protein